MNSYDHYAVTKKIANELKRLGHPNWADRLIDAMAAGSTGTEILMAIRWNLNEMKKENLRLDEIVESQISVLLSKIEEVLR